MIPDPQNIINMANAFYNSCVLFVASDLGIFNFLGQDKKADVEEIAKECNLDLRGARLLLDACAGLGLLKKVEEQYSNSKEAAFYLVKNSPGDLSRAICYNRDVYPAWGKLMEMVISGKPVEKPELHLGHDEARTRTFVLSMHSRALGIGRVVIPLINLEGCKKLLDVGGGPGTYSVLFTRHFPDLESTVIDLPSVVTVAQELITRQKMEDRVKTIAGDYHTTPFPGGNDVIFFFGMLHQESVESIKNLFSKALDALNPGGRVYILDMMTDETRTTPVFSALFAINMALTTENGWVFSHTELKGWLNETGFTNFAIKPLTSPMPHWLAIAEKPVVEKK